MLKFKSQINFNCKIKKKKLQWKFLDERYFEKQLFVVKYSFLIRIFVSRNKKKIRERGKESSKMYKWKVSREGAYWKVLRSIKSFSRVIIIRIDSSRFLRTILEFLKVTLESLSLPCPFNRWPKCFACGSPPTRCTKECSSKRLSSQPLSILHAS